MKRYELGLLVWPIRRTFWCIASSYKALTCIRLPGRGNGPSTLHGNTLPATSADYFSEPKLSFDGRPERDIEPHCTQMQPLQAEKA
jgi:hypothetical protein